MICLIVNIFKLCEIGLTVCLMFLYWICPQFGSNLILLVHEELTYFPRFGAFENLHGRPSPRRGLRFTPSFNSNVWMFWQSGFEHSKLPPTFHFFPRSTLQIIIHVIKLSCNVLLFSNLGKVERPIWNSSLASLDIIACSGNFFPLFNLLHLPAKSFKQNPDWNILIL